jgi:hypothetical protein
MPRRSGAERPVALVTAFTESALDRILATIAIPPEAPVASWYIGSYGVNRTVAEKVAAIPGCVYAPVFGIQPDVSRQARRKRQLTRAEAAKVDPEPAGAIPGDSAVPPSRQRVWGVELGRRFRDQLRAARRAGVPIGAWQFDEVLAQCGSSRGNREFVGGVLRGLAEGRPKLRDVREQGFVWIAATALTRLPRLAPADDVQLFWEDLDHAARFLVGEEYPAFTGNPGTQATTASAGQRGLLAANPIAKSLGARYVVGMTPGWILFPGLGGNVENKPAAQVTSWRKGFIEGRIAAQKPQGYAQFNFRAENARPERVADAVASLRHAAVCHPPEPLIV